MDLALLILVQLAAAGALTAAAAGAGWAVAPRLTGAGRTEVWAVRIGLGLGVLGTALFVLGLVGALHRGAVVALVATTVALGLAAVAAEVRRAAPPEVPDAGLPRWLPAAALAAVLLPAFVWGLFPPNAFDEVTYHLPFARAFVEAQRLVVVPELLFPIFPQLAEVLFAALMLTTGADPTAHLVELLATGLTAVLLYHAGRRFFSPSAGLWAAGLWLGHPLVHYQAASAYVDVVLALFCLLALDAWEVWRAGGSRGWILVAGAAAGFAAATKYLGLLWLALLLAVTLVAGRERQRLRGAVLVGLVALLVGGPWYVRIYLHTGNPVHPFLAPLLGNEPPIPLDRRPGRATDGSPPAKATVLEGYGAGMLRETLDLPRFAWHASFVPRTFDRQAPLAPWHLVLAPLALVFSFRDRRLLRWLLLVLAYALAGTTSDPRFQLPSMAVLALAGAGALHHLAAALPRLGDRLLRPVAVWGLALALAAPGPLYAAFKLGKLGGLPPASPAAREVFLKRELAGFGGIHHLDRRHGSGYTVFAVGAPYLSYHARGRLLGQALGPYRLQRVLPLLDDPGDLHRELLDMEATHLLLVNPPAAATAVPGDPGFRHLAGDARYELYEIVADR